jgi:uncharacterized membrane protein
MIMSVPFKDLPGSPPVPDVDALMRRVHAGAAAKRSRGDSSPADLEQVRRIEQELREGTDSGPAPADDLARLHASWDPLGPHTFTSHRGGVGGLIVAAKQVLRRLAQPVAAVTLARQAEFNGAVVRLLTGASHGVQSLAAGNDELQRRLDELERSNRELRARCAELQAELRGLQARRAPEGRPEQPG